MMGVGEPLTSSITPLRRFSNSPFIPAPACNKPEIQRANTDVLDRVGYIAFGDPNRKPFDDRGLTDAGFACQDRVVLSSTREDVDDLTDLGVASEDRIDFTRGRPRGQIDRELIE